VKKSATDRENSEAAVKVQEGLVVGFKAATVTANGEFETASGRTTAAKAAETEATKNKIKADGIKAIAINARKNAEEKAAASRKIETDSKLATKKDNEDFGKYQGEIEWFQDNIADLEGQMVGIQAETKASKD